MRAKILRGDGFANTSLKKKKRKVKKSEYCPTCLLN